MLEVLEDRYLLTAPYYVTNTADDGSTGTLRDAINQVNAGYYNEIDFAIHGTGVQTINVGSSTQYANQALPALTVSGVYINGLSQGGSDNTKPLIELNGVSAGSHADGLLLDGPNCTVSGLIIERFGVSSSQPGGAGIEVAGSNEVIGGVKAGNVLSGNCYGLVIDSGSSGVLVQGNDIGTDASGSTAVGNSGDGIGILGSNSTIGGTAAGAGNLISGNSISGILLGYSASAVQVLGNSIGTNSAGNSDLGNGLYGVDDYGSNVAIGSTTPGSANLISGNGIDGILIEQGASGSVVQGNYIGTDVTGNNALSSQTNGVVIGNSNNTIGGTVAGARNVISGNGDYGVSMSAPGVTVQGNYIGTNAAGTSALGNSIGVGEFWSGNTIGGTAVGAGNVISGNSDVGVWAFAGGLTVEGNYIGTNAAGTAALGNSIGVDVSASNDMVGGTVAGAGNVISENESDGVQIDSGVTGVAVQGNFIGTNAAGTAPVVTGDQALSGHFGVADYGSNNTIGGTTAAARNIISGNGYGVVAQGSGEQLQGNYIGTDYTGSQAIGNQVGVVVSTSNNTIGGTTAGARNVISGNNVDGPSSSGIYIGASGIAVLGNYIGTSAAGTSALANGYGVTIASSSNMLGGSTVAARNVLSGNSFDGVLIYSGVSANQVQGNYIGLKATGTPLANGTNGIEVGGNSNTLGGTVSAAANYVYDNGQDGIYFDSTASSNLVQGNNVQSNAANGIEIAGNFNTVGGTAFTARNVVSLNALDGILLDSSAFGNLVQGNRIGTDSSGASAEGNGANGLEILGSYNTVGSNVGTANVISANLQDGIFIQSGANGNVIQNSYVGTNAAGTTALANSGDGIEVLGSANTIGGATTYSRNVVSGNAQNGILLGGTGSGNVVQSNFVGTSAAGTAALANSGNGIEVGQSNDTIGSSVVTARNVVSGNAQDGVLLDPGVSGVLVQGNFVGTNANGSGGVGNSANGIEVMASGNTIGGLTAGQRNVVSGNLFDGLLLDSGATGNRVQGNYIGTTSAGTIALANKANGVEVDGVNNTVGGTVTAARNVISGNFNDGVFIAYGATGAAVQGNYIGTSNTGSSALGNGTGVEVRGNGATIGGSSASARNVISGNLGDGVDIDSGVSGAAVQGNYIGTNATASGALGNGGYGVNVAGSGTVVGGTVAGAGNVIANNASGGVDLSGGSGNTVRYNSIYANGPSHAGPGIVLAAGVNNNLVAPTISTATLSGTTLTVTGTFTAPVANVPYVLEFFASPAGDAEGKTYLGKLTVIPGSTGTVPFTFKASTTAATSTTLITATLTDASGDTSAFAGGQTS